MESPATGITLYWYCKKYSLVYILRMGMKKIRHDMAFNFLSDTKIVKKITWIIFYLQISFLLFLCFISQDSVSSAILVFLVLIPPFLLMFFIINKYHTIKQNWIILCANLLLNTPFLLWYLYILYLGKGSAFIGLALLIDSLLHLFLVLILFLILE